MTTTDTTTNRPGIVAGMVAALERDLLFFATGKSTVTPATDPATVPPAMTAAQYLAERDRLNAWADHYRAIGDHAAARGCWQARCRLNDYYRALRPGATSRRPH